MVKNPLAMQEPHFNSWVRKISWRRKWQPTLVFLPGEFHGQRSPEDYSPWCSKALDTPGELTLLLWTLLCAGLCFVTQLCLTLCDPTDCIPPGSSVHGDSPGKNTEVGSHTLLQGIFPTQGLNPGLSHQGSQEYWSG